MSFKLSFLATFGLIVTLPALQSKLDRLPSTLATLVAIPLAASVWVLPLLCYEFNTLATYSPLVNIICTPLIVVISLGGMISAIAGLIIPAVGSAIASLLFYPTTILIAITQFCSTLPGSNWSVGQMPLGILFVTYALFALIWLSQWWQKRWWLGFILPIILVIVTIVHNSTQVQISVLATQNAPVVVVRDRGEVILINSGKSDRQTKYTLLPFLAQQGINNIDYGVAIDRYSNSPAAWEIVNSHAKVGSIYETAESSNLFEWKIESRPLLGAIVTKSIRLNMDEELALVHLQIEDDIWLILGKPPKVNSERIIDYIQQHDLTSKQPIIVWSGDIAPIWLERLQPRMAISSDRQIDSRTAQLLRQRQIEHHNTVLEGEIDWTPQPGFTNRTRELN